jgi:hypothetical protein
MRARLTAGVLASSLLAACAQPVPPAPAPQQPPARPGACRADEARFAIGQSISPALAEQARQRAGALRVRAIRPGQMVTMEFDDSRLNLDVDAGGKVTNVRCG